MNALTAERIEAILLELRTTACKRFRLTVRTIARSHDLGPSFVTGDTVRGAARAAQRNALKLLADAAPQVSDISRTIDGFGLMKAAVLNHLSDLVEIVEEWNGVPLSSENSALADDRLAAIRQDLVVSIDAHGHRFKNMGGRPGEWDWDAAAAHVKDQYPHGFKKYRGLTTEVAEAMIGYFQEKLGDAPERAQTMSKAAILVKAHQRSQ